MVLIARDYLQANYAKPVKLVQLAAVCDASPFHLVRSFRDIIGMPPHAYLTQLRANRARELLRGGETLSGAAYLCGFADQSHLTRTFKRIFGVTPGVYVAGDGSRTARGIPAAGRRRFRLPELDGSSAGWHARKLEPAGAPILDRECLRGPRPVRVEVER
jgi:AraC-like DNA-binding protein